MRSRSLDMTRALADPRMTIPRLEAFLRRRGWHIQDMGPLWNEWRRAYEPPKLGGRVLVQSPTSPDYLTDRIGDWQIEKVADAEDSWWLDVANQIANWTGVGD